MKRKRGPISDAEAAFAARARRRARYLRQRRRAIEMLKKAGIRAITPLQWVILREVFE